MGLLLVDSQPVEFDHRLYIGTRVALFLPFRGIELSGSPRLNHRRWLLDSRYFHLGTLARRLRLLGFDCWYRNDVDDHQFAEVSVAEERILRTARPQASQASGGIGV